MTPEEAAALAADGDRYHRVNYEGIGTIADPAFSQMEAIHLVSPIGSVLEIGCTTGFRLDKAQRAFGAQCAGLEASDSAVTEGAEKYPKIDIRQGVAPQDLNQWSGSKFDVVVVGHLMYLLPRSVLFEFAAQVDSLLADNGHLIVVDFIYH
jgi:cyclopropane fatty-acyl-phospholipid synthase-like methyltransferase